MSNQERELTLSVKEVATQLGVTGDMVRRRCIAGELGHYKIGNTIRVSKSDLIEYIETRQRQLRLQ